MYMRFIIIFIVYFLFIFSLQIAYADEFVMLKNSKVNVRYGPSFEYPIKYVYLKKNLPIKVIDKKENFRRIVDFKKNSGWIHISQLKKSNSLIVMKNKILFKKPTKFSKPIAKIEKGRLLIVKKCQKKWCKVKTGEFIGWIDIYNVWGQF